MTILGLNEELLKKAGMLGLAKKIEENSKKPFTKEVAYHDDYKMTCISQYFNIDGTCSINLKNGIELRTDGVIIYNNNDYSYSFKGFMGQMDIEYSFPFLAPKPLKMREYLVLLAYAENSSYLHEIEFMTGYSINDTMNNLINQLNQDNYIELLPLLDNRIALKQLEFLIEQNNTKKDLFEKIINNITKKTGSEIKLGLNNESILL